jgi:soluble epoxide hydrolase/lipid-phosphate phosphatase
MLGYGLTSRPSREEGRLGEYAIMSMSGDIARLVQHALTSSKGTPGRSSGSGSDAGKVIVISHDHGANFAWKFTHYYPELVLGMVGLCVPYARITSRWASREVITQLIPTFGYQMFFEEERSSEIIQDQVSKRAGKDIEHSRTLRRSEIHHLGI